MKKEQKILEKNLTSKILRKKNTEVTTKKIKIKYKTISNMLGFLNDAKDHDQTSTFKNLCVFSGEELLTLMKESSLKKFKLFQFNGIKIITSKNYVLDAYSLILENSITLPYVVVGIQELKSKNFQKDLHISTKIFTSIIKTLKTLEEKLYDKNEKL